MRWHPHLKPAGKSWRVDETSVKVKGQDRSLHRAVDSAGQTIEFLLTTKRDAAAAKRFLPSALRAAATP
jgi:transposase, IS6 family